MDYREGVASERRHSGGIRGGGGDECHGEDDEEMKWGLILG